MHAGETDTYYLPGILVRFLTRSRDSNGAYCLVEALAAPGAGPPPNRHPGDEESFYVLEGQFKFLIGAQTFVAEAGSFVRVPTGEVHAFNNIGSTPARLLVVNAPGRIHDAFFAEAGEPMPPGTRALPAAPSPPDIPKLLEAGRRNGMEFLLPDKH